MVWRCNQLRGIDSNPTYCTFHDCSERCIVSSADSNTLSCNHRANSILTLSSSDNPSSRVFLPFYLSTRRSSSLLGYPLSRLRAQKRGALLYQRILSLEWLWMRTWQHGRSFVWTNTRFVLVSASCRTIFDWTTTSTRASAFDLINYDSRNCCIDDAIALETVVSMMHGAYAYCDMYLETGCSVSGWRGYFGLARVPSARLLLYVAVFTGSRNGLVVAPTHAHQVERAYVALCVYRP